MPFVPEEAECLRDVTFRYVPASTDDSEEVTTWTFVNPGSYRDPEDPMKFSVLPVEKVIITLEGAPGRWSLRTIRIFCGMGDGPERKIRTHTIGASQAEIIPWWLVKLAGRAQQ